MTIQPLSRAAARKLVPALFAVIVLASCASHSEPQHAKGGTYAMAPPATSELRVLALPGRADEYRIEVHGGGDPGDGAAAGADCYAVAEGRLQGDLLSARFVPFESNDIGFDAAELAAKPRQLTLKLDGDAAMLAGDFDYCPMRTAMAGEYRRNAVPKLMKDCPPLPQACWNRD